MSDPIALITLSTLALSAAVIVGAVIEAVAKWMARWTASQRRLTRHPAAKASARATLGLFTQFLS